MEIDPAEVATFFSFNAEALIARKESESVLTKCYFDLFKDALNNPLKYRIYYASINTEPYVPHLEIELDCIHVESTQMQQYFEKFWTDSLQNDWEFPTYTFLGTPRYREGDFVVRNMIVRLASKVKSLAANDN